MRALLPVRLIFQEITKALDLPHDPLSAVSTVWEDNQAALALATATDPPRLTPQSKFIALKYHWFLSLIKLGEIEVRYIATDQQKANLLTKALNRLQHVSDRILVCGW